MRLAARLEAMGMEKYVGTTRRSGRRSVWSGVVRTHEEALDIPASWKRPRVIFVNSMSDLFHERVPDDFIGKVWSVMAAANHHTYQILTKRPDRMRRLSRSLVPTLPNVWLGTSVESRDYLDRLDLLRDTSAAIRFASFEPLLGALGEPSLKGIDWAIVGGESGPGARPIERAWVEEIRDACERSGTAFFFKQWGGTNKKKTGRELDGRTWDAYPAIAAV
jgi:protein gp37